MEELFYEEGHSIFTFKPGDTIIRVCPTKETKKFYNENLGIETEIQTKGDRSYLGDVFDFIAIKHNSIFLRLLSGILKGRIKQLPLDKYSEGWEELDLPEGVKIEDL